MAIALLEPLELTDQDDHIFLPLLSNTYDNLSGDLSSPSDCPSPRGSFTLGSHLPPGSALTQRHTSGSCGGETYNSPSKSPGWCSMKTPSPIPRSAHQTHNLKLPLAVEASGCQPGPPGTELDFGDGTSVLDMMHFGLVEPEVWSHQTSPRMEPPPPMTNTSSTETSTTGLGITDQGQHLSQQGYPPFCTSFGVCSPLSRLIYGFDQVMSDPADGTSSSTGGEFIAWSGQCDPPTEPQSTMESTAAFEPAPLMMSNSSSSSSQLHLGSPSSPCRANSFPTDMASTHRHVTWVSPAMIPSSQHGMNNSGMQYTNKVADLMCSNSTRTSSLTTDRPWSSTRTRTTCTTAAAPPVAATTSAAKEARGRGKMTSVVMPPHLGGGAGGEGGGGHSRRRKVDSSSSSSSSYSGKLRAESDESTGRGGGGGGGGSNSSSSIVHCDAVIAHNEFACTWPNCIDRATGKQKRFKRQEHKKRHEKTVHEKEGSYRCWVPGCTTTAFTRTDNLKSHLRNTHGKKSPNQRNRYVATQDKNSKYYDPEWQGDLTEDGYPIFRHDQ